MTARKGNVAGLYPASTHTDGRTWFKTGHGDHNDGTDDGRV